MAIPKRAKQEGHGYTFVVRQSVADVGCGLQVLRLGLAGLGVGVASAAVIGVVAVLALLVGVDQHQVENALSAMVQLVCVGFPYVAALPMMLVALVWVTPRTACQLRVDGRLAVLTRRKHRVWAGPVSEVHLTPGEPYWTLSAGEHDLEIINPMAELVWLQEDLAERSVDAGTRADVPEEMREVRSSQGRESS